MSDIVSIESLRKEFQEKTKAKDLKAFVASQQSLIEQLIKEKEVLQTKTSQLEKLLTNFANGSLTLPMTKEEQICCEQIDMLKKKSENRQLTIEEIKILDICIKNLNLIREGRKESSPNENFRDV